MSVPGSLGRPWSNNPNAPQIPYPFYTAEKTTFAGALISVIFYGIVIVLFFQCIDALLNPVDRTRGGIQWGFVAHTTAMFSFMTIYIVTGIYILLTAYIDNRGFHGVDSLPPGPVGDRLFLYHKSIGIVPQVMFILNNWLADGLLLYRCCVIYDTNYLVIAFPCLMFLVSIALGIVFSFQLSQPNGVWSPSSMKIGIPYFSISMSLNILLTLMIVVRLALHNRRLRSVQVGLVDKTYTTVSAMIIESSALYAVSSLLFIGPWAAKSWIAGVFSPILAETQVIAPFLIILRVANRSALTNDAVSSGSTGSIHFRSRKESTGGVRVYADEDPVGSVVG